MKLKKENKILLSIIIPTHNSTATILRAIDSIGKYNFCEILVIDDGSTDNTFDILNTLIKKKTIQYYYQKKQGVSTARNNGAEQATGTYLIFLDADDCLYSNRIEDITNFILNSENKPDLIYSKWIKVNLNKMSLKGREYSNSELKSTLLIRNIVAPGACVFLKKSFHDIGGFLQTLTGCEDWEIIQRYALQNKKIKFHHSIGLLYIKHESNTSNNQPIMLLNALNVVALGFKNLFINIIHKKELELIASTFQYFETARRIIEYKLYQEDIYKVFQYMNSNKDIKNYFNSQYQIYDINELVNDKNLILKIQKNLESTFYKKYNTYVNESS